MKGTEAEYVVPLQAISGAPRKKRSRRAVQMVRNFVRKHTRKSDEEIVITNDVNEKIWEHSLRVPKRIDVILRIQGEKVYVYLKGSKQLDEQKKAEAEKAGEKKAKKEGKEKAKEGEKAGEKGEKAAGGEKPEAAGEKGEKAEEEKERRKEEKREKEKTAEKAARKHDVKGRAADKAAIKGGVIE